MPPAAVIEAGGLSCINSAQIRNAAGVHHGECEYLPDWMLCLPAVEELFQTLCDCAALNPDPGNEGADPLHILYPAHAAVICFCIIQSAPVHAALQTTTLFSCRRF